MTDYTKECLLEVSKKHWSVNSPQNLLKCYMSKSFLVQVYDDAGYTRISVNRTDYVLVDGKPIWNDGITWDELQWIKSKIGFEKSWAVECYPPDKDIVNVANFRHLFIIPKPEFGWTKL